MFTNQIRNFTSNINIAVNNENLAEVFPHEFNTVVYDLNNSMRYSLSRLEFLFDKNFFKRTKDGDKELARFTLNNVLENIESFIKAIHRYKIYDNRIFSNTDLNIFPCTKDYFIEMQGNLEQIVSYINDASFKQNVIEFQNKYDSQWPDIAKHDRAQMPEILNKFPDYVNFLKFAVGHLAPSPSANVTISPNGMQIG